MSIGRKDLHRILFTVVLFGFLSSYSQGLKEKIIKPFDQQRRTAIQEKIFIHTDKDFYITGETVWFSIYSVDGTLHQPLNISKVVYLEILDKDNSPALQTKVSLVNGRGCGSLFLSATLGSGQYTLRAYTNWMKNFDPCFFYHKTLTIVNTLKEPNAPAPVPPYDFTIQFFPEGGNLVSGIESKVGFQAVNNSGKGIDFLGTIISDGGDTICSFKPLKFGIGHFNFKPSIEKKYRAIIRETQGKTKSFSLPTIKEEGWVMKLTDTGSAGLTITVIGKGEPTGRALYIFAHARNRIGQTGVASIQEGQFTFSLDKGLLKDGINHFTIFNSDLVPVCERLYFKQPENMLELKIQTSLPEYGLRKKIKLSIQGTEKESNLSLAVFKTDSTLTNDPANMISWLFLTSDLKGNIESPGSYFVNQNHETDLALDNLMLTHGWRRFRWEELLKSTPREYQFIPEFNGQLVEARVLNPEGKPSAGTFVYLATPSTVIHPFIGRTDQNGLAHFEMNDLQGTKKLIAQLEPTDSLYHVEILQPYSNKYADQQLSNLVVPLSLKNALLHNSISMQVLDIYFEDKIFNFSSNERDTLPFYGKPDEEYFLDDYTRFPVMEEVMREYVKGVWIRKLKNDFRFMVLDRPHNGIFQSDPLILLDGVPVFRGNDIMELDPLKIKRVDVMARKYFLGPKAHYGVVSFATYQGDGGGIDWGLSTAQLDYEGLQLQREFYSPSYETQQQADSRIPDRRLLLFWKPDIVALKENITFDFFSSDIPGNYTVILQGISKDGTPGFTTSDFKITH